MYADGMRKVTIGISLLVGLFCLLVGSNVQGISETIVISTVQVRDTSSSTNESVTLTNISSGDVDITGWCLQYASSSTSVADETNVSWRQLACFKPAEELTHIFLPSLQSATIVSIESGWSGDYTFSATFSNTSGHVRLIDSGGNEVDKVGWGDAKFPEGEVVPMPTVGNMLTRSYSEITGDVIDTDNNKSDFLQVEESLPLNYDALFEATDLCQNIELFQIIIPDGYVLTADGQCVPYIDLCPNIEEIQFTIPDGYAYDVAGDCYVDSCSNMMGLQQTVPEGMVFQESECVPIDRCSNLEDDQLEVPAGYRMIDDGSCFLIVQPLELSEVLPNSVGSDEGNEFIELFNPTDETVSLDNYMLLIGKNYEDTVPLSGKIIQPGGYIVIDNDQYSFTLLNTTTHVLLASLDGQAVYDMPVYDDPREGVAWALFDNKWQYTNQPTPGESNVAWYQPTVNTADVLGETTASSYALKPCAANQSRNPLTNRCKLISSEITQLASCVDGQYRNPTTNRCKNIEGNISTLKLCDEGQERNPDTNRCRSVIALTSELKPCGEGQERNPDTNRCRKVVTSELPKADHGVLSDTTASEPSPSYLVLTIIIVSVLGIGYAIWEWRREIVKLSRKLGSLVRFRK